MTNSHNRLFLIAQLVAFLSRQSHGSRWGQLLAQLQIQSHWSVKLRILYSCHVPYLTRTILLGWRGHIVKYKNRGGEWGSKECPKGCSPEATRANERDSEVFISRYARATSQILSLSSPETNSSCGQETVWLIGRVLIYEIFCPGLIPSAYTHRSTPLPKCKKGSIDSI